MVLLLKLKHNLTKEATEDIARLMNIVSGDNVASVSMHNIQKNFVSAKDSVQIHHVCKCCGCYVGTVSSDVVRCNFNACAHIVSVHDSLSSGHFFFYLPLEQQLIDLFEHHELSHLLYKSRSANGLHDIVDGEMYKCLQFSAANVACSLTLCFNCDGVPVFKSSHFAIWPILCVVNELPPDVRKNHILMAALWFGAGKPDMAVFLEPFVAECQSLTNTGFHWLCPATKQRFSCTATVVVGICDAVARPLMQNLKQFNGHYGCGYCFDVGISVEKGSGRTTVYPFNADMTLRTCDNMDPLVKKAVQTKQPCKGVKGPSQLQLLPMFDIIRGMVPDYMHCVCLGVARQVAALWFDSKNHEEPYYIGKSVKTVDCRLLAIKPPCSVSRTPRSIANMKFWKAHEWLVWLLYYSLPAVKGILASYYYEHWAILVDCIGTLLGAGISCAQMISCERRFKIFVADLQQLYGEQHMSFNVHQLLHIVQSCRDWGPLWSHSAFIFEDFNAVLLKMIRGIQGVPMQILQTFCLIRAIPANVQSVLLKCTPAEQMFIHSLTGHKRRIKSALQVQNDIRITLLGKPKFRWLSRSHYVALQFIVSVKMLVRLL